MAKRNESPRRAIIEAHDNNSRTLTSSQRERERIAAEMDAFIAQGGCVKKCDQSETANSDVISRRPRV